MNDPLEAETPAPNDSESDPESIGDGDASSPTRAAFGGKPRGIRRADHQGLELIDAMAGRASVLGFADARIIEAIGSAASGYLGDASGLPSDASLSAAPLQQILRGFSGVNEACEVASVTLCSSADMAIETAIATARLRHGTERYRTIAMVGSDHGRSGICRTASGRPELHQGFGPMMAGFAHVPVGDVDAIQAVIDDQTACILLSPIQLAAAARPLEAEFLYDLRSLCDQHQLLLMIDETRLAFGASGDPFSWRSIADIQADAVMLAAGLFGGLPGGILIAADHLGEPAALETGHYPIAAAVAACSLQATTDLDLLENAPALAQGFAEQLAQRIADFESIRDVHATGMTIGIETDLPAAHVVTTAARFGLRIEAAGDTAVFMQPPLTLAEDEQQRILELIEQTLQAVQVETAELGV